MQVLTAVALTVCLGFTSISQERFGKDSTDDLRGFTRSPLEHLIHYVDEPFVVRSLNGFILSQGGEWPEQVEVLFEIRGPDGAEKVRGARVTSDGRFKIGNVRPGKYAFKATATGWQSTVGTVIVTKKAERNATIRIVMPLGV